MGFQHTFTIHRLYDRYTQDQQQIFFILGPNTGVGVTSCSLDIAATAADLLPNLSIVLLDMNTRNPTLSKMASHTDRGWATWLAEDKQFALKEAVVPWAGHEQLHFLPVGPATGDRGPAPQMHKWPDVFDGLKDDFNLIIVDVPAYYEGAEARILCKTADEVILVLEAGNTRRPLAGGMTEELRSMEISILGALLNKRQFHIPRWIYRKFF